MLDKGTVVDYATRYAQAVAREFQPVQIVLFGSYVNGNPTADSDIDVAVVFDGFNGNRWDTEAKLWGLTIGISTCIEPTFIDRSYNDFYLEIMRHGRVVWQRENVPE
jgi:predicted nucleotidyltransferase